MDEIGTTRTGRDVAAGLAAQTGPVNAGPTVTIGSDALGVFTLYLVGLLVQRARRGIEAGAVRETEAAGRGAS
jgi:hypothetical protein